MFINKRLRHVSYRTLVSEDTAPPRILLLHMRKLLYEVTIRAIPQMPARFLRNIFPELMYQIHDRVILIHSCTSREFVSCWYLLLNTND